MFTNYKPPGGYGGMNRNAGPGNVGGLGPIGGRMFPGGERPGTYGVPSGMPNGRGNGMPRFGGGGVEPGPGFPNMNFGQRRPGWPFFGGPGMRGNWMPPNRGGFQPPVPGNPMQTVGGGAPMGGIPNFVGGEAVPGMGGGLPPFDPNVEPGGSPMYGQSPQPMPFPVPGAGGQRRFPGLLGGYEFG